MKREGEFTGKDGQSVSTDTVRQGDRSVTRAEGSGGGSAVSVGNAGNRTTIAESAGGDVYAGHDGNVYRKTDDGWQQHQDGGWSDVDAPDRPGDGERPGAGEGNFSRDQGGAATNDRAAGDSPRYGGSGSLESRDTSNRAGQRDSSYGSRGTQTRPANSNYNQLNRDAAARNGGYQNHQRRTTAQPRQMSRGGGARPRRR